MRRQPGLLSKPAPRLGSFRAPSCRRPPPGARPQTLRESLRSGPQAAALPPQTVILQSPQLVPTAAPAAGSGPDGAPASLAGSGGMGSVDSESGSAGGGEGGGGARAVLRSVTHPVVEAARNLMAASAQAVEFADLDVEDSLANVLAQVGKRRAFPFVLQRES